MIEALLKELKEKVEEEDTNALKVRQNLSKLRQNLKEDKNALENLKNEEWDKIILPFLCSEDAKIRKNAAMLCEVLEEENFLQPLYAAYQEETQRFVRTAYLEAIAKLDYRSILPSLKERLEFLAKEELTIETQKHIEEECRALTELIVNIDGVKPHKFTGYHKESEIILLTNRNFTKVTANQIEEKNVQEFTAGLKLTAKHLDKIIPIRTYHELLFVVEGMKVFPADAKAAAEKAAASKLLSFLEKRHEGTVPFYFRLEVKSKQSLEQKSAFIKTFSNEIERSTNRALINSKSNYEIEIRLIANKEGNFNVLLKLHTIPEERFSYRLESSPESIKPVNAALLVEMAKEYMIEDAKILDPFCGVGTLLTERQKVVKGNTSYGIDILGKNIEKAKKNMEAAEQIIHYINKDFFTFTHEYLFDEIFTNMPFVIGRRTKKEVYEIYRKFFKKAAEHLEAEGTIIMHSRNPEFVKELAHKEGYRIIKKWELNKKEETNLFILMK